MAPNIPLIPLLVVSSVAESLLIVSFFPQYLPHNPLVYVLVRALAFNAAALAVYKVLIYPLLSPLARNLPHPKNDGWWPNGLAQYSKPAGQDFSKWVDTTPNDGIIYFRGLMNTDRLLVTSPKAIGELLVTRSYDFEKPAVLRNFLRKILGDGLIIVEGDMHKFQRKHIMPVFSFRHIKELYPMMWKKAISLTEGVMAEMHDTPDRVVEINHWSNKVTMDIIGVAGLGREFNSLKNSDDELIQNYEEILEPTTEKVIYFVCNLLIPQPILQALPWKLNKRVNIITSNLKTICRQLVRDKRELVKKNADDHLDILSVLLKSNNFSDDELVDQLLTFLAAGHETTSSAFTWATHLLSKNPTIQSRLRSEILSAVPPADTIGPETDLASILESLPLLNGVCNETVRLYPTVPITIREAVRPTELLGNHIPAGTAVVVCPLAINRSAELWGPDAKEFKPDRWINEETGTPNKTGGAESNYAIATFLHGPRSCIGQGFAMAELRCLIAAFICRFAWEMADPKEEPVVAGVITTKPRDGMHLRLKKFEEGEKEG
ncbi:putative P450 monooxygenase [Aulographum hederae CBS 113979]|uniref:Putative P450 monooxygenase n=1 Tax=Aulographum hederae CBS 113979 TaxID=1176131 RepID=A0A6G1GP17_9PEZI|nr:putative P450 monooxygenase [Aulographum hederae CBS 113979]